MTGNIIRLRPHHFLCMLTYVGEGYSEAFIKNFDTLCEKINQENASALIVFGPDDICAPLLCEEENCHCYSVELSDDDQKSLKDLNEFIDASLHEGSLIQLSGDFIKTLRDLFRTSAIRSACAGCEWFDLCGKVAEDNFIQGKIKS